MEKEKLIIDGQYHDIELKKSEWSEDFIFLFDGIRFDVNENEFELIIKYFEKWKMKK